MRASRPRQATPAEESSMRRRSIRRFLLAVPLAVAALALAPRGPATRVSAADGPGGGSTLMSALDAELTRSAEKLRDAGAAPLYFLAYRATESSHCETS